MNEPDPSVGDCPRADGMPMLGLGTWQNTDPDQCAATVRSALEMGYRHVDTAQAYGNEAAVGDGIEMADVPRDEVFLATKVWTDTLGAKGVVESTHRSLDRLGVDSVDLLYVHWPVNTYDPEETLPAFDQLHEDGLIDRVGVSNFLPAHLDTAREILDTPIFANQIELHPLLPQRELREYCEDAGIVVVGYSPLARCRVFEEPAIQSVAGEIDATPAQVSLAWLRETGVTAIPKATGEHVRENWRSLSLNLDDEQLARIDAIETRHRCVDPGFAPW